MNTTFRWLLRIFLGLAGLAALALVIAYYVLSRSIPDYSASYRTEGISAEVEIVRNNANVPHIFGATDKDVYFGLGFAHAQDRLWQMTLLRRTAQGRLSEIFGARMLRTDELLRRFDLYNLSIRSLEAQDDETRAALAAYARGVNAWIAQVNLGARGRGAQGAGAHAPRPAGNPLADKRQGPGRGMDFQSGGAIRPAEPDQPGHASRAGLARQSGGKSCV